MKNHFLGRLFSFRKEERMLDCKHTAISAAPSLDGVRLTQAMPTKDHGSRAFPTDEQLGQLYSRLYSPLKNVNSQKRQAFIEFAKLALKEYGNHERL